jgi:hypothetical protein
MLITKYDTGVSKHIGHYSDAVVVGGSSTRSSWSRSKRSRLRSSPCRRLVAAASRRAANLQPRKLDFARPVLRGTPSGPGRGRT